MEVSLQGELKEADPNLNSVIKITSYRTIYEGPRRYWVRAYVGVCVQS